eukprot:TRINITY_DN209_c0_g1_i16.p1 TRINITY_DN209_c0_g1~~TRINITY_DN209_c0_g1_i16.p1  ORF type:complete len:391 (-),score=79.26 TRINITY_DN209_c0_g1_i16:115-1287(-)
MFEPEQPNSGYLSELLIRVRGWVNTLEDKYTEIISEDFEWTTKVEGMVRAASYMITFGRSEFVSELVYAFGNIMVLFNDYFLLSALRRKSKQPLLKKIIFRALTILETFQASIEMFTKRYLGEKSKWIAVTVISLLKSLSRALLVFYLRTGLYHCQAAQSVDRQLLKRHPAEGEVGDEVVATSVGKAWVGSRTHKVIRSVDDGNVIIASTSVAAVLSVSVRTSFIHGSVTYDKFLFPEGKLYLILVTVCCLDTNRPYDELRESHTQFQNLLGPDEVPWSHLSKTQLIAEGVYTVKPIVHLLSMAAFGETSLKSWTIALSMDLLSLYLMEMEGNDFHKPELQELSKRRFNFLYYVMRSPVYDKYFKTRLMSILGYFANRVPLFGRLIALFN